MHSTTKLIYRNAIFWVIKNPRRERGAYSNRRRTDATTTVANTLVEKYRVKLNIKINLPCVFIQKKWRWSLTLITPFQIVTPQSK